MFRNTQPNSDHLQGSKESSIKVFSLLNICISSWRLFRSPQICRSQLLLEIKNKNKNKIKKENHYERENGAELLDIVFDTAAVLKRVNLRKITFNSGEWWCTEQWDLWWRADQSWNFFGPSRFETMNQQEADVLLQREICYSTWCVWGISVTCKTVILMQIVMHMRQQI